MQKTKKKRGEEEPMEVDDNSAANHNGEPSGSNGHVNGDIDHISDDEEGGVRIGDIYIPPAPKPALTFDANGPRLIITRIVNENFKSYAGVQILGPFHKSFTAIIGPNGSGKSNVIDSMLFVFGYRATKIRSKKISVLIHSSNKFSNITSASVAVHFCQIIDGEGEDFTVVPNSEIVVSRTAFKDNSSYYTLNGRRVQFKEVAKMLRSHGIDLDHNRFLILQGEVEQIAMMKPKGHSEHESGMLEYLEDIIGTSRYKAISFLAADLELYSAVPFLRMPLTHTTSNIVFCLVTRAMFQPTRYLIHAILLDLTNIINEPIEQLSVKVEEYSEMRKEKLNRVRLVEAEKLKLEQPMREAVEQMILTNTVHRTRNMLLQKYIHETNKIIESKNKDLDELKENLAAIDGKLIQAQSLLKEKSEIYQTGMQKYNTMQTKKDELTEKLQIHKKRTVSVQADLTQANKKKKNLEQLLETEKGKLIELELIPEKNKKEIEDCEGLLERHTENKRLADEELGQEMAGVREKTREFQEIKDRLQAKLIGLKKIVDESTNNYKLAESALKIYLSTEEKENEKLQRMKDAYEKAVQDVQEKEASLNDLTTSVPDNERKLRDAKQKFEDLKKEDTQISREARSLRAQLEESRQAMNANRSKGRVLDSLMNEKRSGRLPGIFGRLGDLGGIDLKYDIAISTCCGALDNIVVDTVETAQSCVEFLRNNDIGRATFIALDKQQHLIQHYERRVTYPENAPRLFDLIQVRDERVLPAFYFALRDTLVANNLEQATRIAYGQVRYRVVTLKGDVIEIAGTMSGGGRSAMRGRMSSSVQQDTSEQDPQVLQQNENRLIALEDRLSNLREEQVVLEENIISLQRTTEGGKTTLNKLRIEVNSLKEQIPFLKRQIKEQERKAVASRVDQREKERLETVLNEAKEKMEKAKIDAGEVEKEVHGVDAQIASVAGNKVKNLQSIVDDLSKKINKIGAEISKLKITEEINEGSGEFSGIKKEIASLQEKENKLKGERLDAQNNVNKMEKSLEDAASKIPLWEKELSAIKLEDPCVEGVPGIERPDPLVRHDPTELEECSVDELRNRLKAQKTRLGDAKPNIQAIQDYKTKEDLYLKRAAELDEITTKRNEMRALYDQLRKKRTTDFLCGFTTITTKLKEMYQMITLGGDAELELVDSLDPFTEGIIFSVRPPSKSWKNISNLSGGEKTLSSLALVFALHYYRPTPLYVMDEIDAALDFKNVSIVANYIKERTRNAQFIIISLRYNMFEASNRLVGIYKTEDCTKSVTIENKVPDLPERTRNAQFIIISLRYNMFEASNRLVGIYKTEDCTKSVTIENKVPDLPVGDAAA
ncbi:Structural maintenance of chromosomes protein 4 [Papilio xuthus]|uniref:Structural maintenance of chromosomes protein n=1 Tax=Papilio xuthus TaxID=66420 RepID=A0A194PWL2_PAPXU|nr:Structural maintenance of chromosomes protein 4 [Papilio xuthus]